MSFFFSVHQNPQEEREEGRGKGRCAKKFVLFTPRCKERRNFLLLGRKPLFCFDLQSPLQHCLHECSPTHFRAFPHGLKKVVPKGGFPKKGCSNKGFFQN